MLTAETTPPVGSAGSTAIPMPPAVPSDRPASQRPEIEDSGSLSAPGFLEPERHNAAGPSRVKRQHESDPATQGQLFETEPPPWDLAADEDVAVASVVFRDAPYGPYDYRIPSEMRDRLEPGMRVHVPLGKRKRPTIGWCIETKLGNASGKMLSDVGEVLDDQPLCDRPLVRLVTWMSHYYQSPAGQVFDTLIPSSVREHAGTRQRTYLTPAPSTADDSVLSALPPKQQRALRLLMAIGRPMTAPQLMMHAECTAGPINALRKKGLVVEDTRREMTTGMPKRWQTGDGELIQTHELTDDQTRAFEQIKAAIDSAKLAYAAGSAAYKYGQTVDLWVGDYVGVSSRMTLATSAGSMATQPWSLR